MSIPRQTFRILDPGIGFTEGGPTTPLFMGVCEGGVDNTLYSFSSIPDAVATLKQGPLTEAVCFALAQPGAGPILAMKLEATQEGNTGTLVPVTASEDAELEIEGTELGEAPDPVVTLAPFDGYNVHVEIVKAAVYENPLVPDPTEIVTPAEFVYSLDGYTYTEPMTVPVPAADGPSLYPIPDTGLTINFLTTSDYAVGDHFSMQCVAPHYSATEVAAGVDAAIAAGAQFSFIVLTGECESSGPSDGSGVAATLGTFCGALFNRYQFVRSITAAGRGEPQAVITDYANFVNERVNVTYGRADITSAKPLPGWSIINRSIVDVVAARACVSLISSDLGRVADGALKGVVKIYHDERLNEIMDQKRFTTLRTFVNRPGFYITQGRLMCGVGSDFEYWQLGRLMDVACATAYDAQLPMLNDDARCEANGTIDPRDAARFEAPVDAALQEVLMSPNSASGTAGHLSAVRYSIDLTSNVLISGKLKTRVAMRPRLYIKDIVTELGFALDVGG